MTEVDKLKKLVSSINDTAIRALDKDFCTAHIDAMHKHLEEHTRDTFGELLELSQSVYFSTLLTEFFRCAPDDQCDMEHFKALMSDQLTNFTKFAAHYCATFNSLKAMVQERTELRKKK